MNLTSHTRKRIQRHIEALNSPNKNVAARAEANLIRYYDARALEPLLVACGHDNPQVRFRAAWALAYTHDARAYDTLLQLTRDPVGTVRYDAAIALGILGDERAIEPLIALMSTPDLETAVDSAAAMGLTHLGKPAVPALIVLLKHAELNVRSMAARALGNIRDEATIEPLAALLTHPDERTRIAGIEALADIDTPRCLDLIAQCLNDASVSVRESAAYWQHGAGIVCKELSGKTESGDSNSP